VEKKEEEVREKNPRGKAGGTRRVGTIETVAGGLKVRRMQRRKVNWRLADVRGTASAGGNNGATVKTGLSGNDPKRVFKRRKWGKKERGETITGGNHNINGQKVQVG